MKSPNVMEPSDQISLMLVGVRNKGVRLWSENGELRYKAPIGALTSADIERLRRNRDKVISILSQRGNDEIEQMQLASRLGARRAPLSFSQLLHWNLFHLAERMSSRHVASATRLRGHLDGEALKKSAIEIGHRHDALRTRVVIENGIPLQEIDEEILLEIRTDDLTAGTHEECEVEVRKILEQEILDPIDIAVGPLIGIRLLKIRDIEHVLIVTMDHLISDGVSMNILLRDLFATYMQIVKGKNIELPQIPIQFPEFSICQRAGIESLIEQHGAYWNKQLVGSQSVRFPVDIDRQFSDRAGWATVPVEIDSKLRSELKGWSKSRRTTLVMSVFTAYVSLIMRLCNATEMVFQYQINGRNNSDLDNTLGYFASVIYLRIALSETDSFADLNARVTNEYCNAYDRSDGNYLAAQVPRPEFVRSCWFNWIPQEPKMDFYPANDPENAITASLIPFDNPAAKHFDWDNDPELVLFDTEDGIVGGIYFPLNRFSRHSIERIEKNLKIFIKEMLNSPDGLVNNATLI